jgi:hypothetical protein
MKELDETRIIRISGFLSVYVPPTPPPHPDDYKLDFPPGEPPEVHYFGVTENYWLVLREGKMPYMGGTKIFSEEDMAWLRSIEPKVEELLRN